jgi:hypothetical protein
MGDGEDWFYRPVAHGRCRYTELHDGTLDIADVYKLNEMIDIETENSWRAQKAADDRQARR